jgi:uroporphyrinogen III methyltransferase/synthase
MTLGGVSVLAEADVVMLDSQDLHKVLQQPAVHVPDHARIMVLDDSDSFDARVSMITREARLGRMIVRLVQGDPLAEAGIGAEANACAQHGCQLDILPGVPAITAIPTFAGVASDGEQLQYLRVSETESKIELPHTGSVMVNCPVSALPNVAQASLDAQRDPGEPVLLTIAGGADTQRSRMVQLAELFGEALPGDLSPDDRVSVVLGPLAHREPSLDCYESRPLFGWRVLVPRTREVTDAIDRRLHRYGALPQAVATISVEPPRNPQQIHKAIHGLVDGRYEWIVFTSGNAVRAVLEKLEEYGLDSRAFSGLHIAALNPLTAAVLAEWGIVPDLVPEGEQSGVGLVAEFPAYDEQLDPINRVFIPRADIATETVAEGLRNLGWDVEDVTAYRTVRAAPPPAATREAIKSGRFDAVVFTSSSAVRNLIGIAGKPPSQTLIAAIGPATADTCREYGLRVDVVSTHPDHTELVDALAAFAADRRDQLIANGSEVIKPSQTKRRR